jgi:phosphatidylserine/phosphatidylglycerophosphate/cardiolipin synthase-like enzyme
MSDLSAVQKLRNLVGKEEESLARFAAPLWSRVGRAITKNDLDWVRSFRQSDARNIVWDALMESGVLYGDPPVLRAGPLLQLLGQLCGGELGFHGEPLANMGRLVWTMPAKQGSFAGENQSYLSTLVKLIASAEERILVASPFIDVLGIELVFTPLMNAIACGVELVCITHDVFKPSSMNSQALERIRREAERVRGKVSVYTSDVGQGHGREQHPLLNAKLFVIDKDAVLLGSANWTSYAFTKNFDLSKCLWQIGCGQNLRQVWRSWYIQTCHARLHTRRSIPS